MKASPRTDFTRSILFSALIAILFYLVLYTSTERWRVYGNDMFPLMHWWSLLDPYTWLKFTLWVLPVAAFAFGVVRLGRPLGPWRWLAILLLVPAFFFSRDFVIRSRLQNSITSCANHSSFWASWEFKGETALTNSIEFDDFLTHMHGAEKIRASRYCPGRKLAGTKTGVVFVGGGLDLKTLQSPDTLIAFCSWKCHPPPYDHQHYLVWEQGNVNGEYRGIFEHECAINTVEMVAPIKRAIDQADRGMVPYSPMARKILQDELDQRLILIGKTTDISTSAGDVATRTTPAK